MGIYFSKHFPREFWPAWLIDELVKAQAKFPCQCFLQRTRYFAESSKQPRSVGLNKLDHDVLLVKTDETEMG